MDEGSGYFPGKYWVCGCLSPNQRLLGCYFEEDFSKERRVIQEPGIIVGIVVGFPPTWLVHMRPFGFVWDAFQEMDSKLNKLGNVLSSLILWSKLDLLLSTTIFSHPYYNILQ